MPVSAVSAVWPLSGKAARLLLTVNTVLASATAAVYDWVCNNYSASWPPCPRTAGPAIWVHNHMTNVSCRDRHWNLYIVYFKTCPYMRMCDLIDFYFFLTKRNIQPKEEITLTRKTNEFFSRTRPLKCLCTSTQEERTVTRTELHL